MAQPKYPLQAILNQRSREKEDARKAFAAAIRSLEEEQQRLRMLEAEKKTLESSRAEQLTHVYDSDSNGMLSIPMVEARRNGIQFLDRSIEGKVKAIETKRLDIQQAEAEVERRKMILVEADKGVKAIEKHREKWLEEIKREEAHKEQRMGEEIALARFVRDNAESEEPDGGSG